MLVSSLDSSNIYLDWFMWFSTLVFYNMFNVYYFVKMWKKDNVFVFLNIQEKIRAFVIAILVKCAAAECDNELMFTNLQCSEVYKIDVLF